MKIIFFIIFTVVTMSVHVSEVFADNDFQTWNNIGVTYKLDEKWRASLNGEVRLAEDSSDSIYNHIETGVQYQGATKWINYGLYYRYIQNELKDGASETEHRPHFDIKLKWNEDRLLKFKEGVWGVSNRLRFEYRDREIREDMWRVRNKIKVLSPNKFTKWEIRPFMSYEILLPMESGADHQNRSEFGIEFNLGKHVQAETAFLWVYDKGDFNWGNALSLETKIKFIF
jgi:hypothetical protein